LVKKRLLNLTVLSGLLVIMVLLGGCAGLTRDGADTESFATSIWPMLIFIVVLFGLMYFLMIRPQRRKQKEHQNLVEQLHRGDRVITAGGIHGQIESVSEDSVILKVESGATMRVAKPSVVHKQGEPESKLG
jgi:preprotein translocase subunit YajC